MEADLHNSDLLTATSQHHLILHNIAKDLLLEQERTSILLTLTIFFILLVHLIAAARARSHTHTEGNHSWPNNGTAPHVETGGTRSSSPTPDHPLASVNQLSQDLIEIVDELERTHVYNTIYGKDGLNQVITKAAQKGRTGHTFYLVLESKGLTREQSHILSELPSTSQLPYPTFFGDKHEHTPRMNRLVADMKAISGAQVELVPALGNLYLLNVHWGRKQQQQNQTPAPSPTSAN